MIRAYLKFRRAVFSLYLSMLIFFPLIHILSNESIASMSYGMLIITFLLTLWAVVDFIKFRRKMMQLHEVSTNLSLVLNELPDAWSAIEESYQEIISNLYVLLNSSRSEIETRHAEQNDYYTMWVHQIKTPIAAMRLALASSAYDPLFEQELFKIERYAEMALQYVKLNELQSDLVIQEYRLQDIVKDSIKKYAPLFIYKKLSVQLANFDHRIHTDSKWLSFIIEQLLSNSIKYTQQGGVAIDVQNGNLVITDTGIGIRAEDVVRIFEKGYTGYNGRIDKKASGIGLYMAKKVADQLSIKINITSEPGNGTTAVLIFPDKLKITDD